ncbi:MAG TPA: DnaD domain protein [Clostridiaceae bacterium]|nr:DnaD domain protein [Clostridiaceae bacterium]
MIFEACKSILYSDTLVPDIFITEYMPSMNSDYVKVYLYCLFLSKHDKQVSAEDLSKKLEIDLNQVKNALIYLENVGVIVRKNDRIQMVDLKEKEINKIYRPKTTSSPEDVSLSIERNKKRSKIISAINNTFFQGVMSPSWYTDIDAWFDRYGFEEDVMYALFQHCYDRKGLAKQYIVKVAESWYSKNIKNSFDLDNYFMEYEKLRDIKYKIVKKLNRRGPLTEYEEDYIETWVMEYNYDFSIIDMALRKTTSIPNPNFEYINKIITTWHENGLKTKEEIVAFEKQRKQKSTGSKSSNNQPATQPTPVPQRGNFEQRKYEESDFDKLYKEV